jgi:hypothetical protein
VTCHDQGDREQDPVPDLGVQVERYASAAIKPKRPRDLWKGRQIDTRGPCHGGNSDVDGRPEESLSGMCGAEHD